jgi:hypothetical protein
MVVIEDFTKLSEGVRIPSEGHVSRCPQCGRNGLKRVRRDGTARFVHVQTSQIFGDGMRTEPSDCCLLTETDSAGVARPIEDLPTEPMQLPEPAA